MSASVQLGTYVMVVSNLLVDPDVIVVPMFKNPPIKAIQSGGLFQVTLHIQINL